MKKFIKILKAFIFPPLAIMILLLPLSVSLLIYCFAYLSGEGIVSYISFALSAYTLAVLCAQTPEIIKFIENVKQENRIVKRYMTDPSLRVKVSLYSSLIINTAYAVFQIGLGFYHSSFWFFSLAVYYILLAVMRFFLLRDVRVSNAAENMVSELKRYRFCGIILMLMNLTLAGIVFFIAWQNRGFEHHFITTIAMAAFTFTALSVAIVNVIKYRKYNSPLFSAAKDISLVSAAVSLLTLESAMLSAFGEENQDFFRLIMTSLTGAAVCIFVLTVAVYMIVRANKKLKILKKEQDNGK